MLVGGRASEIKNSFEASQSILSKGEYEIIINILEQY